MKKRIIQFYEKPEKKKAKILFLIYLCSGLWFLMIGEIPYVPILGEIFALGGYFNTLFTAPFLIGLLPFLPILFKNKRFLVYLLLPLLFYQLIWLWGIWKFWTVYTSFIAGNFFGFYLYKTIQMYNREQIS